MSHYAAAALLSTRQGSYKPDALRPRVLQAPENSQQEPQTVQVSTATARPPAGPAPSAPPRAAVFSFHIPQSALTSLGSVQSLKAENKQYSAIPPEELP